MVFWPSILIIVFFLIPLFTQLRNFYLLNSNSYFYFSLIFFFAIVDEFLNIIRQYFQISNIFFIESLVSINFHLLLIFIIIISNEVLNDRLQPNVFFWIGLGVFTLFITLGLKYVFIFTDTGLNIMYLRVINGEIMRLCAGIIVISAFKNMHLVIKTKRTYRIRSMWIAVGVLLSFIAIFRIVVFGLEIVLPDVLDFNLLEYHEIAGIISTTLIGLITFFLSFKYPETMLLSQYQIKNATQLYELVDEQNTEKMKYQIPILDSVDSLVDYINAVPNDLIRDDEKKV